MLAVLRLGDAENPANGTAKSLPAFIDYYSLADLTLLPDSPTLALPTADADGSFACTLADPATQSGLMPTLTASAEGDFLTLGCNGLPPGSVVVSQPWVVARISPYRSVDTSTAPASLSGPGLSSVASSDGSEFWAASTGGVYYISSLGSGTSVQLNSEPTRAVAATQTQLWATRQTSGEYLPGTVGSGLPRVATAASATPSSISIDMGSATGLVLLDVNPSVVGDDVL